MNSLKKRLGLLSALGSDLRGKKIQLASAALKTYKENLWFTADNIERMLIAISEDMLDYKKLQNWVSAYQIPDRQSKTTIGLIMAGNIPLVGMHDLITAFIAGHQVKVKLSSKDEQLLPVFLKHMENIAGGDIGIEVVEKLVDPDAVIATGSDNSARYFEHYFRDIPLLLRKNRNSVAVMTGYETDEELHRLTDDILAYFGLGCRNVSKLYVPEEYDLGNIYRAIPQASKVIDHDKYRNNYDYNYAIWMMNNDKFLTNGFLLLKEEPSLLSRIASLNYEYYKDGEHLLSLLNPLKDKIQCVVSSEEIAGFPHVAFGDSQRPALDDYADGVDTMEFLLSL